MKRNIVIAVLGLLVSFAVSACAPAAPNGQASEGSGAAENGASTEIMRAPGFFHDIGTPLSELKKEYPEGEFIVSLEGFPDSAAVCFGNPEAEYRYYLFGTQSGDAEKAVSECEDRLKCAGFVTTAGILFPDMEEDMSFEDFFSWIGVDEYEYLSGEEVKTGEGWLSFMYSDMEVMVNTNERNAAGGWDFTGAEIVKLDAPVAIADPELSRANQDLADAVMFD